MTGMIDRRNALALAGTVLLPATASAAMSSTPARGRLVAGEPPLSQMVANTQYFEIDSVVAGARYAIWVTMPPNAGRDPNVRFPVVYAPDGNSAVGTIGGDLAIVCAYDPINPVRPFAIVSVGYVAAEAGRALAVRARDLLPPQEALPDGIDEAVHGVVASGMLDKAGAELYVHNLRNPAGDKFLAFLQDELHPVITAKFPIEKETAGLYGYSYGGLFAAYVALRRSPLFHTIGAGSPGILAHRSKIFQMYDSELTSGADHAGRLLHMTFNERELTRPTPYVELVGTGASEFIALATTRPLKGLKFSSRIVEFESHATGVMPSWYSFVRTAYGAA